MKIFDFDPDAEASTYAHQGWLHVPAGVSQEFLDHATGVVRGAQAAATLAGPAIAGAKTQHVFDFPESVDLDHELFGVVAAVSGLRRDRLTLSERHIKAYLPDADPWPEPHKDRFASGIAIGITLEVGPGSHVVLYPDDDRGTNPHLTAGLRDGLAPEEQPGTTLRGAREVELHDQPGDVMAFPGSSTWHLRRNAASTVLLYLKFNDMDCDPLGEDPSTALRRRTTLALLDDDAAALASTVVLARRFDSVGHETGRAPGRETWHVNVWEGDHRYALPVPGTYASLVATVTGDCSLAQLCDQGTAGMRGAAVLEAVKDLAVKGAVDLLPAVSS